MESLKIQEKADSESGKLGYCCAKILLLSIDCGELATVVLCDVCPYDISRDSGKFLQGV